MVRYLDKQFGINIPLKRLVSAFLILVMLVCMLIVISSSQLKGSYVSQDLIPQTFTFSDDNQVVMSAFGIVNVPGTYKISDGQIEIKYELFGQDYTWTESFSQKGRKIYIANTEFVKQ